MTKGLELLVQKTIRTKEMKRDASTVAYRLSSDLKEAEKEMYGRLKAREKVRKNTNLYAELITEEKGGNGVPYKQFIEEFLEKHPRYEKFFSKRIEAARTVPVEKINYGRRE